MGKTFFAIGAAGFIVASVAGWAAIPTSQARVADAATLDPFKMMTSAKQMPPSTSQIIRSYSIELPDATSLLSKGLGVPAWSKTSRAKLSIEAP
jgi:hypothetical protein